ncbi:MAG: glycosyltransferase [Mediterranea sp.]|jgi:glycosyltransferase involved in cell wall biosynthesis|nr:glycosyltransferase [Mediterranea sp.]
MTNPAISIFMPVYNGGKYLARTFDSIAGQTFGDFEVICVDDSSTDDSLQILQDRAAGDHRIKVFVKPNGGNVPKSWLFALPHLTGRYIFYLSQDDMLAADLLELTYKKAVETGADAVVPDMVEYRGGNETAKPKSGLFGNKDLQLTGREAFRHSLKWDIHAFALWKAELVKRIGFDDLATNSDEYATRNFFLNSNKVVFSGGTFYYGKENPDAITRKLSVKRFDWCITNLRLLRLMKAHHFDEKEIASFNYDFWGHTMYMDMLLKKYGKSFGPDERARATDIIAQCYGSMDFDLIARYKGAKGRMVKALFSHGRGLAQCAVSIGLLVGTKTIR